MTPIADALELAPDQDMSEAADLMVSKGITGAPVVDNGKLVGVLSQFDFLLKGAGVAALDLTSASYRRDVQKILNSLREVVSARWVGASAELYGSPRHEHMLMTSLRS